MRLTSLLFLLCTYVALAQIHPPFKRLWTTNPELPGHFSMGIDSTVLTADSIYFSQYQSYGRMDRATGKMRWQKSTGKDTSGPSIEFDGKRLYVWAGAGVAMRRGDKVPGGELIAVDGATGRKLWSMPAKGYSHGMLAAGGVLYWEPAPGTFAAMDLATRKKRWTARFPLTGPKGQESSGIETFILDGKSLYIGVGSDMCCLNARTGKQVWRAPVQTKARYGFISRLAADGKHVYAGAQDGVAALSESTGKQIWWQTMYELGCDPVLFAGSLVLVTEDGKLCALYPVTGAQKWEIALSKEEHPRITEPLVDGNRLLISMGSMLYAIGADGKQQWQYDLAHGHVPVELAPAPKGLLVIASSAVMRYVMGVPEGLPTDPAARGATADKLMKHVDRLSPDESRTLMTLGDQAFEALLAAMVADARKYDEVKATKGESQAYDPAGSRMYDELRYLGQLMRPEQTGAILAVMGARGSSLRSQLVELLAFKGDDRALPVMLEEMNATGRPGPALNFLARSKDEQAVSCLIAKLEDPRADPVVRNTAYSTLAANGGERGLKAVLAQRDTSRTVRPLSQRMDLDSIPMEPNPDRSRFMNPLRTKHDAKGTLWGVISSPVLGSGEDLWIVRWDGKHWTDPVFTGANIATEGWRQPDEQRKAAAKLGKELLDQGQWFTKFVGNAVLQKDSDGDGLTDIVEQRLGTNPKLTDTDGDGIPDGEDRNPLVAPRALSEEEQVLWAAFEARYRFFGDMRVPATIAMPKGIAPMELAGWEGIILAYTEGANSPEAAKLYGEGVANIRFTPPSADFDGNRTRWEPGKEPPTIMWSPDRKRARLGLATYYGGLNGTGYDITLQKFGDVWVVIECREMYVS